MLKEFKDFAVKGNMLDMAVGIIIGAAFGTVVSSFVNDILMPVVSAVFGSPDFSQLFAVLEQGAPGGPYTTIEAAQEAGAVTMNYGLFINSFISLLLVALALFFVVKGYNRLKEAEDEEPAAPPADVALLQEIRDLLARS